MKKFLCVFLGVLLFLTGCEKNPSETEKPTQSEEKTVEIPIDKTKKEASPLEGKIILIDAGHGINSSTEKEPVAPGSSEKKRAFVEGTTGKNQTEEELNLSVALKLEAELLKKGANVHMTRKDHKCEPSNVGRAEVGNELGADLVVRIHADGNNNKNVSGASCLIPGDRYIDDEEMLKKSRMAGEIILEEYVLETGAKNNGIAVRNDMTGFNWSKVPVILMEMGFMTNPGDDALMETEEYQGKIVTGIMNGLERYFDEV